MLYGCQVRAARALAGCTQEDLAEMAEVGTATIGRMEERNGPVRSLATIEVIAALERLGIRLVDDGTEGPGVRFRSRSMPIDDPEPKKKGRKQKKRIKSPKTKAK